MKILKFLMIGGVGVLFLLNQAPAFATGGGIVLDIAKTGVLQKFDNTYMAPLAGTNLEFFVGGAPAPNSPDNGFNMDTATDYPASVVYDYADASGKTPVINAQAIVLRIWDGAKHTQGSHYGIASYAASNNAPANHWTVAKFRADYYASQPTNAPVISGASESNARIGSTNDVVLKLSWSYTYNGNTANGIIQKTGYIVRFWKEGEATPGDTVDSKRVFSTAGDSFALPDKDALNQDKPFGAGTYNFQAKAINWFSSGPWSSIFAWKTLSGGFASAEVTITLKKITDGLGVNSVGVPFTTPFNLCKEDGTVVGPVTTLADLITQVTAAGAKVTAAGYWGEDMKMRGITYDASGNPVYKYPADFDPATLALVPGRGYYLSVDKTIKIVLKK